MPDSGVCRILTISQADGNESNEMLRVLCLMFPMLLVQGCINSGENLEIERKNMAKRWIRGVYCSDPTVVDDLAGDDIIISYPVFEAMFGKPFIRGREAVKEFGSRFSSRWSNPEVIFHEVIAEDNRVVLIWSFKATAVASLHDNQGSTDREHKWGGITLIRFNDAGKIIEEIGEESEPGPIARVSGDKDMGRD
jgi:hypothetical protein